MLLLANGNATFTRTKSLYKTYTRPSIRSVGSVRLTGFMELDVTFVGQEVFSYFFARLPVLDHMAEEGLLTHSDDPKNNQNLELRYTRLSLLTGGSSTSNSRRVTISTPITSRQPSSDLDWRRRWSRSWSWGRSWWWDHSCWWDQSYWDWYGWNQNYWDQSYWDQNYWWDRRYWGASTRANGQNQNSNQISRTRTTGTSTCEIRFRIN